MRKNYDHLLSAYKFRIAIKILRIELYNSCKLNSKQSVINIENLN